MSRLYFLFSGLHIFLDFVSSPNIFIERAFVETQNLASLHRFPNGNDDTA